MSTDLILIDIEVASKDQIQTYGSGTIYGMSVKTTIYLPEDLKKAVENEALRLGQSEAEIIRNAISMAVGRPGPRGGLYQGEPIAETADDLLTGFGER